jgi:hypothetical protein
MPLVFQQVVSHHPSLVKGARRVSQAVAYQSGTTMSVQIRRSSRLGNHQPTHPVLRRRQFFYGRRILPHPRCFGLRLAGDAIEEVDARGVRWELLVDTRAPDGRPGPHVLRPGTSYDLGGRALGILKLRRGDRRRGFEPRAGRPAR